MCVLHHKLILLLLQLSVLQMLLLLLPLLSAAIYFCYHHYYCSYYNLYNCCSYTNTTTGAASTIATTTYDGLRFTKLIPAYFQLFNYVLYSFQELNRLRKAALSFGFFDLLDAVSQLLERECTMLPGNAHPDAALQLTHAANILTSDAAREMNYTITPMRTYFTAND